MVEYKLPNTVIAGAYQRMYRTLVKFIYTFYYCVSYVWSSAHTIKAVTCKEEKADFIPTRFGVFFLSKNLPDFSP
jgi:hypothetical protein